MPVCAKCEGRGWYADHEAQCFEDGDCSCSGVQVQCECADGLSHEPDVPIFAPSPSSTGATSSATEGLASVE